MLLAKYIVWKTEGNSKSTFPRPTNFVPGSIYTVSPIFWLDQLSSSAYLPWSRVLNAAATSTASGQDAKILETHGDVPFGWRKRPTKMTYHNLDADET